MDEIRKIDRATDLAIYKPGMNRAINVRSQLLNVPEVIQALNQIDRQVLEASIKTPIADISDEELTRKTAALGKYIARDAGIKNVDDYSLTRFVTVLKSYYPLFSLQEIRIAFELSMAGELDEFLPRDKYGNPDKNHYQTFNIEYITKILNAYKKRSREAEHKAYMALPAPNNELPPETKELYRQHTINMIIGKFKEYQSTGNIKFDDVNDFVIYNELEAKGLAFPIEVTEDDEKEAVTQLIKKSQSGLINKFVGECIRRLQTKHSDVPGQALIIARQRAIMQSFDRIIKEKIELTDYFK